MPVHERVPGETQIVWGVDTVEMERSQRRLNTAVARGRGPRRGFGSTVPGSEILFARVLGWIYVWNFIFESATYPLRTRLSGTNTACSFVTHFRL